MLPPFSDTVDCSTLAKHMESLEARFSTYLRSLDSVEDIDRLTIAQSNKRPPIGDYLCKQRQIVVEQKCVTTKQSARIQELVERKIDPKYLHFYGTRELQDILKQVPNGEEINKEIYRAATRLLEKYLKQARGQIESTKVVFDLPLSAGMLLVLNEKITELSPEIMTRRLMDKMSETRPDGSWRFGNINFALLISETHLHRGLHHRCILIEGPDADRFRVAKKYIDRLVKGWSSLCGGDVLHVPADQESFDLDVRK